MLLSDLYFHFLESIITTNIQLASYQDSNDLAVYVCEKTLTLQTLSQLLMILGQDYFTRAQDDDPELAQKSNLL